MNWKKFRSAVSNTLSSVDKFKEPVKFNLKGNDTFSSSFGGLISLVIVIFLAYNFVSLTVEMAKRNSQQVIQRNEFQNDPESVYLNQDENFVLAITSRVGDYYLFNMTQYSAISFKANYHQVYTEGGNVKEVIAQILWAPCNRSNFKIFSDKQYKDFYLDYSYCAVSINYTDKTTGECPSYIKNQFPDCITPPNFRLQGTRFSQNYEYIDLKINLCDPQDASSIYGLTCSQNAFNETTQYGGVDVSLGFTNIYIDPTNYSSPNQTFIDFIDYNLNPYLSRTSSVYVDMETIQDYDDFLFANKSNKRTYFSISADKMREQPTIPREYLLQAYLQRSKVNHITTRIYVKILDVVSSIGGLSGPLFLVGSILAAGYAHYKYVMIISNELYDFETTSTDKSALYSVEMKVEDRKKDPNSSESSPTPFKKQSKINNINAYFTSLKAKKKLKYNHCTFLKGILPGKKNTNEQLVQKAKAKVTEDLDVTKMINKMKEIDKIKMLLLNQNQLEAFNFIKKPQITLREEQAKPLTPGDLEDSPGVRGPNEDLLKKQSKVSKYEKLYMIYRQLKEDKNSENNQFNQRLLSMIDEDIIRIFNKIDMDNQTTGLEENQDQ